VRRTLFIFCCLAVAPAFAAADPTLIGSYGDWKAYQLTQDNEKTCFMTTAPLKQEGPFKKRGEVAFFVTRWPEEKNSSVISVTNGYNFKSGSPVTLAVGDKKFDLFAKGDTAWAKDPEMDSAVIAAFENRDKMSVEATSKRDSITTDTYSLKGSLEAYRVITKECSKK